MPAAWSVAYSGSGCPDSFTIFIFMLFAYRLFVFLTCKNTILIGMVKRINH